MRTAVVGCGHAGRIHAKALTDLKESEFVACSGGSRAEEFAKDYGITSYSNVSEMVRSEKVDVVTIATPHPAHAAPAIEALESGASVLVEKPLASNLGDCDSMLRASESSGSKLGVISQRRLYEPVIRVKNAIDDGKIGEPTLGTVQLLSWRDHSYYESAPWRGTWEAEGGGVLVNQAVHVLDLLIWLMGPIDKLSGYWTNVNHPTIEVDDTAVAVVRFRNRGLGSITVSNSQQPGLYTKVHIHGSNGATVGVQTDGGSMFAAGMTEPSEAPFNDIWTVPGEEHLLSTWQERDRTTFGSINPIHYFHQLQIHAFLEAISKDTEPPVSGFEGRQTVEAFTALYLSQSRRHSVKFPVQHGD